MARTSEAYLWVQQRTLSLRRNDHDIVQTATAVERSWPSAAQYRDRRRWRCIGAVYISGKKRLRQDPRRCR